jgi:hypothetical protein
MTRKSVTKPVDLEKRARAMARQWMNKMQSRPWLTMSLETALTKLLLRFARAEGKK